MKFTLSVSALAAFAATVLAQTSDFDPVFTPEKNEEIAAGKTFEITWEAPEKYADGTVSLHLIGGEDQESQVPIADLAAGIPNTAEKYSWEVDASLGDDNVYGLVIKYESDPSIFQYSNPFHIEKAEGGEGEGDSDKTTTVSKDYGTRTVTLSSCDCEETSTVSPPPAETTSVETTPTPSTTSSFDKPTTIETKPVPTETDVDEDDEVEPTPSSVPEEGAGARFGASSVALVAAFVVAAFSL